MLSFLKMPPHYGWLAIAGLLAAVGLLACLALIPVKYSWRNLIVRWRTTLATAFAFTLVTTLLVVMMAFINGMVKVTENTGRTDNVVVLGEGSLDELFSNLGYGEIGDVERAPGVALDEKGEPLASRECYMTVSQPLPPAPGGAERRALVSLRGVDNAALSGRVRGVALKEGTWLGADGWFAEGPNKQPQDRCFVGAGFAREFAKQQDRTSLRVGDTFEIAGRTMLVAGVMASDGTALDNEVWVRRDPICVTLGKKNYTTLALRSPNDDAAKKLAAYLRDDFSKARLAAQVEREYYSAQQTTAQQLLMGIVVVGMFMAVGGVFGIMNTMFAAIAQRSKDIGVLRIIGYQRSGVLVAFFLESMLLALLGGALGCAIGYLVDGRSATSIMGGGGGPGGRAIVLRVTVDGAVLAIGMGAALLMGALGGIFPAISAMRLRPLESLR